MGDDVVLVSSAEETAKDVYATLLRGDLLREEICSRRSTSSSRRVTRRSSRRSRSTSSGRGPEASARWKCSRSRGADGADGVGRERDLADGRGCDERLPGPARRVQPVGRRGDRNAREPSEAHRDRPDRRHPDLARAPRSLRRPLSVLLRAALRRAGRTAPTSVLGAGLLPAHRRRALHRQPGGDVRGVRRPGGGTGRGIRDRTVRGEDRADVAPWLEGAGLPHRSRRRRPRVLGRHGQRITSRRWRRTPMSCSPRPRGRIATT